MAYSMVTTKTDPYLRLPLEARSRCISDTRDITTQRSVTRSHRDHEIQTPMHEIAKLGITQGRSIVHRETPKFHIGNAAVLLPLQTTTNSGSLLI